MSDIQLGSDREHAEHRRKDAMTEEWEATRRVMQEDAPHMANIYAALAAFQSEVGLIAKDGRNEFHRYNYASLEQWVEAIRPVLARHGLSVVTSCLRVEDLPPLETAKGGALRLVRVTACATLFHVSGGSLVLDAYGEGSDSGDKAVYKAMTGARKYLLAALSGTATSDDPEHDEEHKSSARGASPKPQVAESGRSSGVRNTPRAAAGPAANATEDGLPLSEAMLALSYLDDTLGFGKHKDVSWGAFCGGGMASGRIGYLSWYLKQEHKTQSQQLTAERAREVCKLVEEREMTQARNAQDQADDPAWEYEKPLPGEVR